MSIAFGPESAHLVALDRVLRSLERVERRIREAEAERLALLAEAFDISALESERAIVPTPSGRASELAYRAVRAEVATVLRQSERTAERHMSHAVELTRQYPRVLAAYREGLIAERHTSAITEAGTVIGAGDAPDTVLRRAAYEEAVLEVAVVETPNRLQPLARRLAERFAETPLDERHAEARGRRRVYVVDGEDGMADLVAHLPAVEAHGIYQRLTRVSRTIELREAGVQEAGIQEAGVREAGIHEREPLEVSSRREDPAPRRKRDEIRADILADLLLASRPGNAVPDGALAADALSAGALAEDRLAEAGLAEAEFGRRVGWVDAQVQVTIAEESLLTHSRPEDAPLPPPPVLAGYGPIDTGSARRLAGRAEHWDVLREHPETGEVLSVERYRPSERMRRFLRARDQHCRFPGCRMPIARCDIDHTIDAAKGGRTSTDNLAHLCRGHHTLKHHTGWRVRQGDGGTLEWMSPTGRRHRDRSERRVVFTPVGGEPGF